MFRIRHVPPSLDKFFRPLTGHLHWHHDTYFRVLVVPIALMWGRRHVATLDRDLDPPLHRTRCTNFFLVERWDPEAARRQQAQEWLRALPPQRGEPLSRRSDASQQANRGHVRDAVAKMKDPTSDASMQGHQDVCRLLVFRQQVIPWGLRLSVKQAQGGAVGVPFRHTPALAAQLIRELQAPASVKVMVRCDAYSRCPTVVKACREQHCHLASTLKSPRRLFTHGWQRKAGRSGRNRFRRRRTATRVLVQPAGEGRSRDLDAGWLQGRKLGGLQVVFSRTGGARQIRGLVTDAPEVSAARLIQAYDRRWEIAPFFKARKPWLELGHAQKRPARAAVIHRHLVCFASALLTHRRMARRGAQGQRTRDKAANRSPATAQDQLRGLLWEDLVTYLKEQCHEKSALAARERLRVA
jgi:hypothetical protein